MSPKPGQHSKFKKDRKFQNLYSHLREGHWYSPRELAQAKTLDDLQRLHDGEHATGQVQDHVHPPKESNDPVPDP